MCEEISEAQERSNCDTEVLQRMDCESSAGGGEGMERCLGRGRGRDEMEATCTFAQAVCMNE